jgi:hypothetical protein
MKARSVFGSSDFLPAKAGQVNETSRNEVTSPEKPVLLTKASAALIYREA